MTREEEIEKASNNYFIDFRLAGGERTLQEHFEKGAQWADKHPSVDTIKKIVSYALKRTNIMLAEDLENGVEWELLIKKAMEEKQ